MIESLFEQSSHYHAAESTEYRGIRMAARFAAVDLECAAARESAAVIDRSHRGLLVARGDDRKSWLNNLVTNVVSTLGDNEGNYAFATDVKGRTQFDLNVLSLPHELWLDIDLMTVEAAKSHLERYLITEIVELHIASEDFARIGCAGPRADRAAKTLGVSNFSPMAALSSVTIDESGARLVRHDFLGLPGFELIVPASQAADWWQRMVTDCGATPIGVYAAEALRIEAGIPAWGFDIDESVIPPETGQFERGINHNKGCYLGQEIIERMRSFGSLGKRLVRLTLDSGEGLTTPIRIERNGSHVGRLTSLVRHPPGDSWIGLGYLRTSLSDFDNLTVGDPPHPVHLVDPNAG